MRMLKNVISIALPDCTFLCSSANEHETDGSILDLGHRLAQEVLTFVRESCPGANLGRLTFIGHSLGGLIVRAALPYLDKLRGKMHGYLSLCSPHLGYMQKAGRVVNVGLWLLKKWRKSKCLEQLTMGDHRDLEKTCLYEMSKVEGLAWFRHMVLVSSYQDQYAPFDSARIQICQAAAKDVHKGNIYIKMANNLLSNVQTEVLYRLDVNFKI